MMYNRMKIGCELPYSNWFSDQFFTINGTTYDYIDVNGIKKFSNSLKFRKLTLLSIQI